VIDQDLYDQAAARYPTTFLVDQALLEAGQVPEPESDQETWQPPKQPWRISYSSETF
jgi:hypothetical protein